jgi:LPS export ABC transporter protein LptC
MNNLFPNTSFLKQAALIVSCLFVFGCENDPNTIRALSEHKVMMDEGKNIQAFLSQNGKMRAKLTAPVLLRYTADTQFIEFPKSLHVNFFDSLGRVESQVDARYGKYFETQNKVYLRDSVIVFNMKGDTLRSPDLWWDQNSQRFYTDKQVRIKTKGDRIYGGMGLEAKQDLSDVIIKQPTGLVSEPSDTAKAAQPDSTARRDTSAGK